MPKNVCMSFMDGPLVQLITKHKFFLFCFCMLLTVQYAICTHKSSIHDRILYFQVDYNNIYTIITKTEYRRPQKMKIIAASMNETRDHALKY